MSFKKRQSQKSGLGFVHIKKETNPQQIVHDNRRAIEKRKRLCLDMMELEHSNRELTKRVQSLLNTGDATDNKLTPIDSVNLLSFFMCEESHI